MKPHEETWTLTEPIRDWSKDGPGVRVEDLPITGYNEVINGSSTEAFLGGGARLVLAVQAPAMARLLLELEWAPHDEGAYCLICQGGEPAHMPNCSRQAVLRAAGVIE